MTISTLTCNNCDKDSVNCAEHKMPVEGSIWINKWMGIDEPYVFVCAADASTEGDRLAIMKAQNGRYWYMPLGHLHGWTNTKIVDHDGKFLFFRKIQTWMPLNEYLADEEDFTKMLAQYTAIARSEPAPRE